MTSYCTLKTDLAGDLLLTANATQLTGVYFSDCGHAPAIEDDWEPNPRHAVLQQARDELQDYLKGRRTKFLVPMFSAGTDFQQEIWRQIARIPFGQTITYSELAERAGMPRAIRATGTATGRNPLSIIVPCHRVLAKGGGLGGYAGGLDRKKRLLEVETLLRVQEPLSDLLRNRECLTSPAISQ